MAWIVCIRCEKFRRDFVARTFALVRPFFAPNFVRPPNGSECTQIVRNAQNVSLGSNRVDRVRSLRKIPTRLRDTNFCTSSASFAPSFVRQPNGLECTQIVLNAPKRQLRVQCGVSGPIVAKKFRHDFVARTFGLVWPV